MVSQEYNIYRTLFANYQNVTKPSTASALALRFFILMGLDQKQESLSFFGDFEMSWIEPTFAWDPAAFEGRTTLTVPENIVWIPDVTVYNSMSQVPVIDYNERRVTISSDGTVLQSNPAIYTTACVLDMNSFPFDTQTCEVRLSSWAYPNIDITLDSPEWLFNYSQPEYIGDSEWTVHNLTFIKTTTVDNSNMTYEELRYTVKLKRSPSYYVNVIMVPTFVVSFLSLIGLFTPFDNEGNRTEKITLGVTTLLSLSVMLNIVGDDISKSSHLPLLGTFVMVECLLIFLCSIITTVLLFIHQRAQTRRILSVPLIRERRLSTKRATCGFRSLKPERISHKVIKDVEDALQELVLHLEHVELMENSPMASKSGSIVSFAPSATAPASSPIKPNGLSWFVTGLFVVGDLAGGGLVALPTAMIQSEFWIGIGISVVMQCVVTYTAYVLGLSWNILLDTWDEYHHHCRKPYPEIAYRAMGPLVRTLVSICIDITQFGIAVVYLLLSAKNIHDFIKAFFGGNFSFCYVVIILAICLLPVTFLKSPQDFWWAVVIAMITTSCAVVLIIIGSAIDWGVCESHRAMPPWEVTNFFLALGTLLFAYGGHSAFPTIQHDMRNPKEFTKSVILAFSIMACMYGPVCVMGYLVYGDSIQDSIIPSIQTTGIQQAINILITIHCILTLTIVFNPLNQEIEELFNCPQEFCWQRCVIRTAIMACVVFVAESVPNFGPLLDLVGGSTITLTSVVLPCLFYLYLKAARNKEKEIGCKEPTWATFTEIFKYNDYMTIVICSFIICFGLFGGGAATYSAIRELTSTQFSLPCYVLPFKKNTENSTDASTNCCGPYQNISHSGVKCTGYTPFYEGMTTLIHKEMTTPFRTTTSPLHRF